MTLNIGGGNTSFVKVNGSHLHRELKKEYRELEPAKTFGKTGERSHKSTIANLFEKDKHVYPS